MDWRKGAGPESLEAQLRYLKSVLHVAASTTKVSAQLLCHSHSCPCICMQEASLSAQAESSPVQLFVLKRQLRLVCEHANAVIPQSVTIACRQEAAFMAKYP